MSAGQRSGEPRDAARGIAGVEDALAGGTTQRLHRISQGLLRRGSVLASEGLTGMLHRGLHLGADGLVAGAPYGVLSTALLG